MTAAGRIENGTQTRRETGQKRSKLKVVAVYGDVNPKTATVADAERLLKELLPRAFRRPIQPGEERAYTNLVAAALNSGLCVLKWSECCNIPKRRPLPKTSRDNG